jgi:hypothetical protein
MTRATISPPPCLSSLFADRETQVVFDAFNAGARSVARMLTESTLETQAFREKLLELAK